MVESVLTDDDTAETRPVLLGRVALMCGEALLRSMARACWMRGGRLEQSDKGCDDEERSGALWRIFGVESK